MDFANRDRLLTDEEVSKVEERLHLQFPVPLRRLFMENNGGEPDPYVFRDDFLHTVVNETLPLISDTDRETAIEVFEDLVLTKKLTDTRFFPFAVDAGGDYFFVDCSHPDAPVHFYRSDSLFSDSEIPLVDLGLFLDAFWERLGPEDRQE